MALNPLKKVLRGAQDVAVTKQGRVRKLHKAFLRYHDAENWPMLREALKEMGREDLIGNGKHHLIPSYQPAGTGRWFEPSGAGKAEVEEKAYIHSPPSLRSAPRSETRAKPKPQDRFGKPSTTRPTDAAPSTVRRGAGRGSRPGVLTDQPATNGRRGNRTSKPKK